jgi:hypothetical protein
LYFFATNKRIERDFGVDGSLGGSVDCGVIPSARGTDVGSLALFENASIA